jgi:sugar phosphate isomerase/epimerase
MSETTRRSFLRNAAGTVAGAAATVLGRPAGAIEPIKRSGPSKIKLGLAAYSYRDYLTGKSEPHMTLVEFVDRAAKLPLDGVELTEYYFPKPVTPEYTTKLKRQCYLLGLGITGSPMATRLTYPAGPLRDKELARIRTWVDNAVILGAPTVRIFAGDLIPSQSLDEGTHCVIEAIDEACEYAGKQGVMLVMENHHGVTADADGVVGIAKGVKSDWFGLNLDFGNFNTPDPYVDLARCAPYAVTTHVKTEITPKGGPKQLADLKRFVTILKEVGYRGYATLEYEAAEEPLVAVPRILNELRALL